MINLDYYCIKYGQRISREAKDSTEADLHKTLGVLREDGVYAAFLWLDNKNKGMIIRELLQLLNEPEIRGLLLGSQNCDQKTQTYQEYLRLVHKDIDSLLLTKKLIERSLTYGLYHTKNRIGEVNVDEL